MIPAPRLPRPDRLSGALRFVVAGVLSLAAAAGAAPAVAATPPPIVDTVDTSAAVGRPMEVFVNFFPADHDVQTYLGTTPLATLRTGSGGSAETYVPVPTGLVSGPTQLVATDTITGLTVTTPVTVRTDWQQPGSDPGHAGANPGQQLLTAATVGSARPRWQVRTLEGSPEPVVTVDSRRASRLLVLRGSTLTASRTSDGGTVWQRTLPSNPGRGAHLAAGPDGFGYVLLGGTVSRVSLDDGSTVWSKDLGLGATASGESISWADRIDGAVVVTANSQPADASSPATGVVAAYDAAGGRLLWRFRTGVPVTEAAVEDGKDTPESRVFVGTATGKVFALSLTDAALLWSVQTTALRLGRPAYADGTVVFAATTPFGDNPFGPVGAYAFSADRGRALWRYDTGYDIGTATRAAISGGTAYLGFTESGYDPERAEIRAVDLATGTVRWSIQAPFQTAYEVGMTDPTVAGGVVYLGSCGPNHKFLGYDAATGAKLLDVNPQNCATGVPVNQRVYLADSIQLTALGLPTEVAPLAVLNDTATAAGPERIGYSAGWLVGHTTGEYKGDDHYSYTAGATATVTFTGTGVRWWFTRNPNRGIAAVSIDGAPETAVNGQASPGTTFASWTSPVLSRGPHTLRIRVTGTKSNGSTSSVVTLDRIDVDH